MAQAQAAGMVIVDREGRPRAIVHEASVAAVPLDRRPWVPVDSVARSIATSPRVPIDAAGETLLTILANAKAPELLVVDGEDRIVGVLATRDVEAVLRGRLAPTTA
jgi:CBS-domain-containing membrane protein